MSKTFTPDATTARMPLAPVATGQPVIELDGLRVSYGPVKAVRNVTLQVRQGEIFGLLGPNGAGKTTTLSSSEGLVRPEAGAVRVLGMDVWKAPDAVQRYLGISLQSTAFFDNLKLWEL